MTRETFPLLHSLVTSEAEFKGQFGYPLIFLFKFSWVRMSEIIQRIFLADMSRFLEYDLQTHESRYNWAIIAQV